MHLKDLKAIEESSSIKRHHFSFGDSYVAVVERSNGEKDYPTLFFLHGRFGHSEIWWPIIDRLFPTFRCFLIDLPGFGQSFSSRDRGLPLLEHARLVEELIKRMLAEDEKALLIGHDVGGAVAQLCACSLKERVSGVVLINCAGLAEPIREITGFFGWAARWQFKRLLDRSSGMFETKLLEPWRSASSRRSLLRALRAFESSWPGPFERQYWKKELQNLPTPVLLLWGSLDPLNPSEIGVRMVRELKEAYFFERENAGHWPNLDAPDWVTEKIQEFVFRVAVPPALTSARRSL